MNPLIYQENQMILKFVSRLDKIPDFKSSKIWIQTWSPAKNVQDP